MIENKFERAPYPEHPGRCQGRAKSGQCPYMAVEGSTYCPMHGGTQSIRRREQENVRNYRLAKYEARVNEFADNNQIKSLREEIGITRMLLEETVNKCRDGNELILYSTKISDLVMKLEKLVTSCHRLEASSGLLLDKQAALQIGGTIVEIISRHIEDPEVLSSVADEICMVILQTQAPTKVQ